MDEYDWNGKKIDWKFDEFEFRLAAGWFRKNNYILIDHNNNKYINDNLCPGGISRIEDILDTYIENIKTRSSKYREPIIQKKEGYSIIKIKLHSKNKVNVSISDIIGHLFTDIEGVVKYFIHESMPVFPEYN